MAKLTTDLNLHDEIRDQLGLGFTFTHSQSTSGNRICASRLDRHYLPVISGGHWTSDIIDTVCTSDHSAVVSSLEIVTTPRGHDVFTVNPNLIKHLSVHSELRSITFAILVEWLRGKPAVASIKKLKHEVRKYLRKETKKYDQRYAR